MTILITYASIGGNTMMVAQKIEEVLQANGHETELLDMDLLPPEKLAEHEVVFLGSSTWGDGEYNDFSQVFFDKLKETDIDLSKTKFAIYGLGETFYTTFCNVVDLMKEDVAAKQGQIIGEPIKIDGFPDDAILENVNNWVLDILKLI